MMLIGSLRLVAGLVFLGVVIALCLWLLIRLFPGIPNTSEYGQDHTVPAAFRKRTEHKQNKSSGGVQKHSRQKNDEKIPR
jgi:hypothetical protein